MGHGSYQSKDWNNLRSARNINQNSTVNDIYRSRQMRPNLDPNGVKYRESCDSMDNPASTAIIFGLDVTGSMGYLSEEIAKGALNRTMLEIYEKVPVTNPHIMFQAIGDSKTDDAPLQVTQFEADIRIAEQLLDVWFEGRGGGNGGESYLLSWYFADKHTKIDCYDKRGEKGFLFTIGDERCHKILTKAEIKRVFGDLTFRDYSAEALYEKASRRYEIFHIVMKALQGTEQRGRLEAADRIPGRRAGSERSGCASRGLCQPDAGGQRHGDKGNYRAVERKGRGRGCGDYKRNQKRRGRGLPDILTWEITGKK